ncbi:hypothetical protein LCGC14_0420310 [marine sediment metagenome]|uniref:Uncharacterized protein n=1 Tax=marine sediment metagenome TaxID=412755 RepID=A0A0F9T8Y5_9ZZZZ
MDIYEEYLRAGVTPGNLERCPERIGVPDSVDRCKSNKNRVCDLETYIGRCDEYENFLKEE